MLASRQWSDTLAQATLSDALAVLRSSPMIFALCLMVISYGVGHRLFEFAWKGQLRLQYPSALAYQVWSLPCNLVCEQIVTTRQHLGFGMSLCASRD